MRVPRDTRIANSPYARAVQPAAAGDQRVIPPELLPPSDPFPGGVPWLPTRPAAAPVGPPGLAALLDAETSVLRDLHERERILWEASRSVGLRELALDDAIKLQHDAARRQTRGMRDRLRARELDRRLLTADARRELATAKAAREAAELRVRAVQHRLNEVQELVDAQSLGARPEFAAIRRAATLPPSAVLYPTIPSFISDAPGRATGDPRQQALVGEPLGDRWRLEEHDRPWITTTWRVAWNAPAGAEGELYAVEHALRPHAARRVWLLGRPARTTSGSQTADALLAQQHERNSLALLAATLITD